MNETQTLLPVRSVENGVELHLHLDEVWADHHAITYGSDRLIGIKTSDRIFRARNEKHPPEWWAAQKKLCLGGGGDFTDEHRNGSAERFRGTSASMLMYQRIGVIDPIFQAMAEEVNWFDSHVGCPRSHLANLLKIAKANMPGGDRLWYDWSMRIFRALYRRMKDNLQPARSELPFGAYIERQITAQSSFDDASALGGVIKLVDQENDSVHPLIFSARHIYEALWRTRPGSAAEKSAGIVDDMRFLVSLLYKDQQNFHSYRAIASSEDFDGWFEINIDCGESDRGGRDFAVAKAAMVQTDNPQAHNALRSLGAHLSIVKNSKGHVTILGNKKIAGEQRILRVMHEGIQNLIAFNRFCDLPPGARKSVTWEILSCFGNSPVDKHWYLAGESNPALDDIWLAGYCGTIYHDEVPKTSLPLWRSPKGCPSLQENAECAFSQASVEAWKVRHRVPVNAWFKPLVSLESWLKPVTLDLDRAFKNGSRR